jgi:hypothetical protein
VRHGLVTKTFTDALGREQKLRVRPTPDRVQIELQNTESATVHVWVEDEAQNELGRVELSLAVVRTADPLTGRTDQWLQAQIVDPNALSKPALQSGGAAAMLEEIESIAREHNAREIVSRLTSLDLQPLFEAQGFQVRRNRDGECEVFSALD